MTTAETSTLESMTVHTENIVDLPFGLLGFERIKKYVLLSNPDEVPFRWFQVLDDPTLAFLVISPADFKPDYRPELTKEDVDFLGLTAPTDALVYNIVTMRGPGRATVNLKGPVVINRYTLRGKQAILANATDLAVDYPLTALA